MQHSNASAISVINNKQTCEFCAKIEVNNDALDDVLHQTSAIVLSPKLYQRKT